MTPHPATNKRPDPDEARFRARLFDAVLGLNAGRISWDDYDREFCKFGAVPRALHDLVFGIWNIYDPEYPGNRKNTPPEAIYRILLFLRSNERQPDKRKERGLWDPFPSVATYAAAEAAFGAEVFARFVADGAPGCTPEALRAAIDDCLRNGPPSSHSPCTIGTMDADEIAAFHARRDEENLRTRGPLSYEEWLAERERLAAFLSRRGVRAFDHGGLDPSARRSWRERLLLLSGRLRRGRAFKGDFGLSDDWFENRLFGLQLLSSRMFRSDLLSAIRRHLGSPDNGFAVSIATDFPIVTETIVTARECVTDFAGDAVAKAEALARTDAAARRQLRDLRRLLGGPSPVPSPLRRWLRRVFGLAIAGAGFVVACNLAVLVAAAGRVTPAGHATDAPARRAAVVMGCVPKLCGGWDNPYFTARIEAAAALWRAGKVEALVVSGDNHVVGYDEPSEMKTALVAAGVPEDRIVCDYAGFRTLDSVVRAKTIFGLDSFLVVSQDFHVRRAIFLGRCRGLDVRGYAARGVRFGRLSSRTVVREPLARVAAVLDILRGRRPRFGGPPVPLPPAEAAE